jgi:hypothetical protein
MIMSKPVVIEMFAPYPNPGTARWIVENIGPGRVVLLDDGSEWNVDPANREIARRWPKALRVTVTRTSDRHYVLITEDERAIYADYDGFAPGGEGAQAGH